MNIPTATKRFLVNVMLETTTLDDYLRCELYIHPLKSSTYEKEYYCFILKSQQKALEELSLEVSGQF